MMGKVVGGIRVKYQLPINTATDTNALALLDNCSSLDGLQSTWMSLSADEKKLSTVIAKKETLKNKLK